jgi:hypothetical protein
MPSMRKTRRRGRCVRAMLTTCRFQRRTRVVQHVPIQAAHGILQPDHEAEGDIDATQAGPDLIGRRLSQNN